MKRLFIFCLCVLALLFVSCSEKAPVEDAEKITQAGTDTQSEKPLEPDNSELAVPPEEVEPPRFDVPDETMTEKSPLTGMPCTPEAKSVRPVAVVFNNLKVALPQVGISDADVVWECDMEGGVTRLLALFSDISKVGELGSVRSARDYFLDIATSHGAILVHAGGSPSFYADDKSYNYDNIDGVNMYTIPSDTFWRDPVKRVERGQEHSLMTGGEKLLSAFASQKYKTDSTTPKSPLNFYESFTVPDGEAVNSLEACHSSYITTRFTYDSEKQRYYKESYDSPHIDEENGEQLSFENVLVLYASQRVVDEDLRLEINLVGSGQGVLLTAGKKLNFTWSRSSVYDTFTFKDEDGKELLLNPGKTHITVFDKNSKNNITIK